MAILFRIFREGRDFYCSADGGTRFFVGRKVPYDGNIGLYNVFGGSPLARLNFEARNYRTEFGFWAEFIEPTARCEGRNFLTLNSYDRAAFTFGFAQFAAHVPNGDFVVYFRDLLSRPEADQYFPSLAVIGGRITKIDGPSPQALENDTTTAPLMAYLNPSLQEVEDEEVIAAAKLIHWTTTAREARLIQIEEMVRTYRKFMREASRRGLIAGRSADQCCVIADILHHGRGGRMAWTLISEALRSGRPFENLIEIGAPRWRERKATLKRGILANPAMATLHWNAATSDFA